MKKSTNLFFIASIIITLLLVIGCPQQPKSSSGDDGGVKGGNSGSSGKTYTLYSVATMDGSVIWYGASTYTASAADTSVNIGDWDDGSAKIQTRCYVSFDLSSILSGSQINSAVLRVYQNSYSSGNSYTKLGNVTVSLVTYDAFTADKATGNGNWDAASIGTLSTVFTANTWHTLDVTTQMNDEWTNLKTGRLQFKMRHDTENNHDGFTDMDGWVMGDSATNRPELVVTIK